MAKVIKAVAAVGFIAIGALTGGIAFLPGTFLAFTVGAGTFTALGLAIGASLILQAVVGRPRRAASASTLQLGEQPRQAVLGRAAVAGSLVDIFSYGGKYGTDWEVLVIALADHRCDALEGFFVDDTYVAFTADGTVAGFNNQLQVFWRSGTWDQTVPSILTTNGPGWTANDRGRGVAYVVVAYKADASDAKNPVWPGGRPRFRWVVRGLRCYQARKDSTVGGSGAHRWNDPTTWEWTENPIDIRYNWVRGIYAGDRVTEPGMLLVGRGLSAIEAPPANVFARANICDEVVDGAPRYRIGGVVASTEPFIDVESDFAAAVAGTISQPEGAVEVNPGVAKSPIASFTDADLLVGSSVTWNERILGQQDDDWLNTVAARFVDPAQRWNVRSAPVRRDTADVIADGGPREAQPSLDFVTNLPQAQRVAEIIRRLGRLWGRAQVTLPPRFASIEEGDWVTWQSDRYFDGATLTFQVEAWGSNQAWHHQLTLRQISSSVYSDTAPLSDGVIASSQTPPPTVGTPGASAWVLTAAQITAGGVRVPALLVTGQSDDPAAQAVVIEYVQQTAAPDVSTQWRFAANARVGLSRIEVPVPGGGSYWVAVSYVVQGVLGDRRVLGPVTLPDFAYPDGVSIAGLKPAEAGANVTETRVAAFISGQGALATQNNVNLGTQVSGTLGVLNADAGLRNNAITIDTNGVLLGAGTSGVTVDNTRVAGFANQALDSEFTLGNTCWGESYVSGGTWDWNYFTALTSKRFLERSNASAIAGQQVNLGQTTTCGIPVVEGERIECSAIVSWTNMNTPKLYVGWFTAAGVYVGVEEVANAAFDTRVGGFVTVPSGLNIATAKVMVVCYVAANGWASARIAQPFIRRCPTSQAALSAYNPGPLHERGANVTETRVAAAITGQGALATSNNVSWGAQVTGRPNALTDLITVDGDTRVKAHYIYETLNGTNSYLHSRWPAEFGANVTETRVSAAIAGQGALATQNNASWSQVISRPAALQDSSFDGSGRLNANMAAYLTGVTVDSLRPQEAGANVTETRVASAITGQGTLATANNVSWGGQVTGRPAALTDTVTVDGQPRLMSHYLYDVLGGTNSYLHTRWPAEFGANVTETRVAAAISGQGDLATRNAATLPFGSNFIVNSDFARGTYGWFGAGGTNWGVNLAGWFGHRNVMWMNQPFTLAAGAVRDIAPDALWNGRGVARAPLYALPVVSGDRLYARALIGRHRCNAQVLILLFDSEGNYLTGDSASGGLVGGGANGDPSNFSLVSLAYTVSHSSARWALPVIRMVGTGEDDAYIFFTEPAFGKIPAGQTAIPSYVSGRSDTNADATATINGPAELTLSYSSSLALASPLPVTGTYQLVEAGTGAVTSGVTWSVSVVSGSFSGAAPSMVGTGSGQLRINSAMSSPEAELKITATVAGRAYPAFLVKVSRNVAAPDSGSVTVSAALTSVNSSSFTRAHGSDISITLPSGVTSVSLSAIAELSISPETPTGATVGEGKWQRETSPGTWADVGGSATSSPSPDVYDTGLLDGLGNPVYAANPGSIVVTATATGLSAGSTQKFRFMARVSSGNVRTVTFDGNASASA